MCFCWTSSYQIIMVHLLLLICFSLTHMRPREDVVTMVATTRGFPETPLMITRHRDLSTSAVMHQFCCDSRGVCAVIRTSVYAVPPWIFCSNFISCIMLQII